MRKALLAGATALVLALLGASGAEAGGTPVPFRFWSTPTGTALITSCTEGNSAALYETAWALQGAGVHGEVALCQPEASVSFGLEFFTATGASGYFIPYNPLQGDFIFRARSGWSGVIAVCISIGPNERLACAQVDPAEAGAIELHPIPVDDPHLVPSGNMYPCLSPSGPVVNPTCATCV
jgi:hypothetical protein